MFGTIMHILLLASMRQVRMLCNFERMKRREYNTLFRTKKQDDAKLDTGLTRSEENCERTPQDESVARSTLSSATTTNPALFHGVRRVQLCVM